MPKWRDPKDEDYELPSVKENFENKDNDYTDTLAKYVNLTLIKKIFSRFLITLFILETLYLLLTIEIQWETISSILKKIFKYIFKIFSQF